MTDPTTRAIEGAAKGAIEGLVGHAQAEVERQKAYQDRNRLAITFCALIYVRRGREHVGHYDHGGDGWRVVYAELPTGLVSWHVPAEDVPGWLPCRSDPVYDGHDREEKNARLREFVDYLARRPNA